MGKVLELEIDPDIKLDESRIEGMSEDLQGHLLTTLTIAADRYECHWTDLTWSVKMIDGQPVINVKRKS
jgi:hypothetical protein